ncbi:MAG: hypothetical protein ABI120_21135 [Gemmatimonadaceae bacterium]
MIPVSIPRATTVRLFAAVLLVPLASCLSVVDNNNNLYQYGAVTVRGLGGGAQASANASGVFFSALSASIPDSRLVQNSCAFSAVDTTTPVSRGDLRAGSAVTLISGAGSSKTTTTLSFNSTNVSYVGAEGFSYKAGDSATVSVPGDAAGFPGSSVTVRLAEPIIPADITTPLANDPMLVRWNVGDSTSAIILSIKYANPITSTYANEQVVCSLRDDGAEDIAATALGPFLLSPLAKRSVKITRWRTSAVQPGTRSLLHIVSTVDSTAKLK